MSAPSEHRVAVVGAGVGGLVCALLLAARGLRVTVLESQGGPGGKMRQSVVGGQAIDAGPTVFTMRWVLEQIFERAGASLSDHLRLQPLDVLARHAWSADECLDLLADVARSADAIGRFSGAAEAQRFLAFCEQARKLYDTLEGPYIRSQRPTLPQMARDLGPRGLAVLAGLGPFATLAQRLSRQFDDPRLRQLFGRYATYCGASPWAAPATLMLVAQVELDGVWAVQGGMHAVARALEQLAVRRGALVRYDTTVERIEVRDGRACGVRLASGEVLAADSVVFNGDSAALADGLLGDAASRAVRASPRSARSLSAVTWALRARTRGFPLVRHNVFFDTDYKSEFDDVFRQRRLPRRGTVYVCAQDRNDTAAPIDAAERLLCLVNAPPDGDGGPIDPGELERCETNSFALLARCGLEVDRSAAPTVRTTPTDFHLRYPATGGALYGAASHGWMALFRRSGSASGLPGLYLAGGSVHPGPGVPMAAMSGQLAAATLMAHLDSTSRSRRVVIAGGMSTRSATMAPTG
ncbi:MAG TPA: phytoene desaturase family protein [Rubrivivax sp.]